MEVAGNFHFAPGKSFQMAHMHVHDLMPFMDVAYNMSHVINHLSFGQYYPGRVEPLNGVVHSAADCGGRMELRLEGC